MEYGNGIVGDMCIHMLDMVRWMLDLGWPKSVTSAGGILVDKASKANITDTQTATFDFDELAGGLAAPHLGRVARPEISVGRDHLRRQGHAQSSASTGTSSSRSGKSKPTLIGQGVVRVRQVSRGQDGEGPGAARRVGESRGTCSIS